MIIGELCKEHNVDTTKMPKGILNIKLGENPITQYNNFKEENGKIIFTGKTGNADTELTILLKDINEDEIILLESYLYEDTELPNDFPFKNIKKYLFTPSVIIKTSTPTANFIINYNVLGKEVNRV